MLEGWETLQTLQKEPSCPWAGMLAQGDLLKVLRAYQALPCVLLCIVREWLGGHPQVAHCASTTATVELGKFLQWQHLPLNCEWPLLQHPFKEMKQLSASHKYSRSSPNGHSCKGTALLMATFTKPFFFNSLTLWSADMWSTEDSTQEWESDAILKYFHNNIVVSFKLWFPVHLKNC